MEARLPALSRFRRSQTLPITREQAWAFFSDPRNLPEITPKDMGFRVLSDPPAHVYPGLFIAYSVKPFPGFSTTWVSEITHVDAPDYFVDEQRMGPYTIWHHEHWFRPAPGGGVEVEDIVHYALPFGWAGKTVAGAFVRRRLEAIFRFREESLSRRFNRV
jgi:ligand-binding SRPBCC domain-containing protein